MTRMSDRVKTLFQSGKIILPGDDSKSSSDWTCRDEGAVGRSVDLSPKRRLAEHKHAA
ncbi:hypothetical protein [Sphingomonas profundi]|uniref:hypothetical protein n=1 Tax=Alterirhizorhabdus profundi TaxID=2681549 RepID=UPI0012E7BA8E|nr:hypothetical protein [Sphingomonas profundi]